jgi:hypothetical protein
MKQAQPAKARITQAPASGKELAHGQCVTCFPIEKATVSAVNTIDKSKLSQRSLSIRLICGIVISDTSFFIHKPSSFYITYNVPAWQDY